MWWHRENERPKQEPGSAFGLALKSSGGGPSAILPAATNVDN